MRIEVPGEGPRPSPYMFVGEAPGRQEANVGRPFVGDSGKELWFWCPLHRGEVYVTNLIKARPPENRDPYPAEIEAWSSLLQAELEEVRPSLVVTLGRFASRWFLPHFDYDRDHGLPHVSIKGPTVFPILHPAACMHEPQMYTFFWRDMLALTAYLKGGKTRSQSFPISYKVTQEFTGEPYDAVDTESDQDGLISIQVSDGPGRSFYIPEDGTWKPGYPVVLQNARHDLRELGFDLSPEQFEDTMLLARLCGDLKAGLKSLSKQLCGLHLRKFTEVVGPYADQQALEWLEEAEDHYEPQYQERISEKTGKVLKPKLLPRPKWHLSITRCLRSKEPRALWLKQDPHIQEEVAEWMPPFPPYSLRIVPEEERVQYACLDADATGRVFPILWKRHKELGLEEVYQLDKKQYTVLSAMEARGMRINPGHFKQVSQELDLIMDTAFDEMADMRDIPEDFSPTSPIQTSELVWRKLGLVPRGRVKRTKGGLPSSDDAFLQPLKNQHPVIDQILIIREAAKLKSSYADKLPLIVDREHRYHPSFGFTITGRLTESIVLLIPKRSSWGMGKKIRRGFVPSEGMVFGSWDLSQIELRVLASDSQDPVLLDMFATGKDPHAITAHKVLGAPEGKENQDDGKHRIPAKSLNFGIPMGLSADGLLREIASTLASNGATEEELDEWTKERCQEMIEDWYEVAYPVAGAYLRGKAQEARDTGRVTDWLGRTRWLPAVWSPIERVRAEAERQAQSFPMQAGAQEVAKMWQWNLWHEICKRGKAAPVLLIHDDNVLEFREEDWEEVNDLMIKTMPQVLRGVPVASEGKMGPTWGDL